MRLINDALDFLAPKSCRICGHISNFKSRSIENIYRRIFDDAPDLNICSSCISSIVPYDEDKRWFLCLSEPVDMDKYPSLTLFMPFSYDGIISKIVPIIKFGKEKELARLMGIILSQIIKQENIKANIVCPIPLSDERMRQRGFNQAQEIAVPIAKMLEIPCANNLLIRTINTLRQTELKGKEQRRDNVSGAFKFNEEWDISGQRVILVDDVATTGFTLHEAATILLDSGASEVLCVALAGNRQAKNSETF